MPRFSIIIPVYNVERYLEECLLSVVGQTYKDFEIILVDDGSPDSCPEICDEWAKKDSRVKVIHKENGGAASARNMGIDKATGEYVLFLDGDDYWSNNKVLSKLYERLSLTKTQVLSYNYHKTDGVKNSEVYFKVSDMPVNISVCDTFKYQADNDLWIACPWNKVILRELFDNKRLRFREGVTSEDIDWCARVALLAESFDYLSTDVVAYLQRSSSISNHMTATKINMFIDNVRRSVILCKESKNKERYELLKPYLGYQCATLLFNISEIDDKSSRNDLILQCSDLTPLLKYSKNKKARIVKAMTNLFGLKGAAFLMNKYYKFLY